MISSDFRVGLQSGLQSVEGEKGAGGLEGLSVYPTWCIQALARNSTTDYITISQAYQDPQQLIFLN